MDTPSFLPKSTTPLVKTIDMHTTGEPTRIICSGFPDIQGTLLEQRATAKAQHDHIRRLVIHEPRGHQEMYGAVLRPDTEHTDGSTHGAHMGVLFLTHDGYSTMCGHATLAVARMLVDCTDTTIFPRRSELRFPDEKQGKEGESTTGTLEVELRLHVPCGVLSVTVPVQRKHDGEWYTDPLRPIGYTSVPSFAPALGVRVHVPEDLRWPGLGNRDTVTVEVSYGGAFFLLLPASELGFGSSLATPDIAGLRDATAKLKAAFNGSDQLREYLHHPNHVDLQFLYSVIVTEDGAGTAAPETNGVETGLCFFGTGGNWQIDRSPTGSGVQARVAVAVAKEKRKLGEEWTYHSILSAVSGYQGAFIGKAVEMVQVGKSAGVTVEVRGRAYYTGYSTFIADAPADDEIGLGFDFAALGI